MNKEEVEIAYAELELERYRKQNTVIKHLLEMRDNTLNDKYKRWILEAINYIYEEKIWVPFVNASAN